MKSIRISEHTFIPSLIESKGVVLDCGANHGVFSRWISENTNAVVHAFEPNPNLYTDLPKLDRVQFHSLALGDAAGLLKFHLSEDDQSSSLHYNHKSGRSIDVEVVSLETWAQSKNIRSIELLKLDIEGAEIGVLLKASEDFLRKKKQICVEFHESHHPEDLPEVLKVIERLKGLDFYVCKFSHYDHGDVFFINKKIIKISAVTKIKLLLDKYWYGLKRILKRLPK